MESISKVEEVGELYAIRVKIMPRYGIQGVF